MLLQNWDDIQRPFLNRAKGQIVNNANKAEVLNNFFASTLPA